MRTAVMVTLIGAGLAVAGSAVAGAAVDLSRLPAVAAPPGVVAPPADEAPPEDAAPPAQEDAPPADEAPPAEDAPPAFELEIDPELDARFGPRAVNAADAAVIVEEAFPGARVTEAELDERDGGPVWEMTFELGGDEREVEVDADDGTILDD